MKWKKNGLIYGADKKGTWMDNSALQPTPLLIGDKIRIFAGFRDKDGIGRVGFVDVDADNPSHIQRVSEHPCLDIGEPGCFDDNGVVPCAVIEQGGSLYLFYAGYNVGFHVRMLIYCGLAVSTDHGEHFERVQKVPVMERIDQELLFRVVHTVLNVDGEWYMYYGAGSKFRQGKDKTLPVYEVKLLKTNDFRSLHKEGKYVLRSEGEEYRVGRPYVIREDGKFKMFVGAGSERLTYRLLYAESQDGENWERMDDKLNLEFGAKGDWDSEMMAYPSFIRYQDKAFLFYNGNNYGYEGFGYAELLQE